MNPHALAVLEYPRVLERVARRALSSPGRERVLGLAPGRHPTLIRAELQRVEEMARFLDTDPDWAAPEIPDARGGLKRLELAGSLLEPLELFALGRLLAEGRALKEGLAEAREALPSLSDLREGLHVDLPLEKAIEKVVDHEGAILDSASKELGRLRASLRRAHSGIVRALEKYLKSLPDRLVVADASVTIREGRYVIPIRREGRGEVGGVVLDESATGVTLFVEPPLAQQLMNELREMEREETREINRILRQQTESLRPSLPSLKESQESLLVFDTIYARARAALAWEGRAPELLPERTRTLQIVEGRHPLLLTRGGVEVVPFHLELGEEERVLVVSGPNTGGKSVFLKALGLIITLTQSGIVPPVGKGTRLPLFTNVFADIGDEQSIADNLSTFSAHLGNLHEIVEEADDGSLVLIDEMGTGTDPQEGAALSRAILEELVARGSLTVVTSHLGALKRLDGPNTGIVNASLQFDPDRIEPTYQLQKGRPGRSYGLAIAQRLGFPGNLLERAREHLPQDEVRLEELLATLERREREATSLTEALAAREARAKALQNDLQGREAELLERERTSEERARTEARRLLLEARREVEEAIEELRSSTEGFSGDSQALDEAARYARRRVEEAASRQRTHLEGSRRGPPPGREFIPGDRVRLAGSGAEGTVVELREGRAVVEASGVRLQLPSSELHFQGPALEKTARGLRGKGAAASTWQGPEADPKAEVDLRGMRVMEIDLVLERAMDQALLGGLGELRIIHGKGTGALRQRVAELLENDGRIQEFRMGLPSEGGAGVTMVKFK